MDQLGGHKGTKKALVLIILLVFAGLAAAQDVACPLGGYIDEATGACSYGITINIAYPDWLTESEAASTAVGTLINDIQTGFLGDLSMMVGPYFNGAYLDVSYQEFEHGAPLRSIVFTISTYTGGAHGNVFFDSVTVDTFANRALSLADDIFIPGADVIATLQPLVVAQLVEQQAEFADLEWINSGTDLLPANHQIGQAEILFAQIEDDEIQKQLDKLEATKTANKVENAKAEPQKDIITFEDFAKVDLRIGTIIEAEKMPKANKLLVLKVDTGIDVRTIVSGIAEHFTPEEVIGKRVTVLVNLAPRALRGVESEGMLLLTNNAEGKLVFVNPDAEGVINGAMIS